MTKRPTIHLDRAALVVLALAGVAVLPVSAQHSGRIPRPGVTENGATGCLTPLDYVIYVQIIEASYSQATKTWDTVTLPAFMKRGRCADLRAGMRGVVEDSVWPKGLLFPLLFLRPQGSEDGWWIAVNQVR